MTTPYVGEIRMFGFQRIPTGWLPCDGSLQQISQYDVLYILLGTTFGGDGNISFGLPDLRGQVPVHQGTGNGLSPRVLGLRSGSENVTLIGSQLPAHTHQAFATSNNATTVAPGPTTIPGAIPPDTMYAQGVVGSNARVLSTTALSLQGGNTPHNNLMPTQTVSFCIAWAGIFPSQGS